MDIKPCNILLNRQINKYDIKLSDFGESKFNKNTIANTQVKGTLIYMSPELICKYIQDQVLDNLFLKNVIYFQLVYQY